MQKLISLAITFCSLFTLINAQLAEVEGTIRSSATQPQFLLYDSAPSEDRPEGQVVEASDNIHLEALRGDLRFGTGTNGTGITRMTIDGTSGNVGVGTTTPDYSLDIEVPDVPPTGVPGPWGGLNLRIKNALAKYTLFPAAGALELYGLNVKIGSFHVGTGVYSPISDRRVKRDIHRIRSSQLLNLMALQPSSYYMVHDKDAIQRSVGLIAQEVKKVYPEVVQGSEENGSTLTLEYTSLIPFMIKGIQELVEKIEVLEQNVNAQQEKVNSGIRSRRQKNRRQGKVRQ